MSLQPTRRACEKLVHTIRAMEGPLGQGWGFTLCSSNVCRHGGSPRRSAKTAQRHVHKGSTRVHLSIESIENHNWHETVSLPRMYVVTVYRTRYVFCLLSHRASTRSAYNARPKMLDLLLNRSLQSASMCLLFLLSMFVGRQPLPHSWSWWNHGQVSSFHEFLARTAYAVW